MRAWAAPLLVVLLAAAGGFAFSQVNQRPAASSPQLVVEQRLLCPQCQEVRLDVCDRPDVARRLAAGESQDAIVAAYRQAYGPSILADNQPAGPLASLLPWLLVGIAFAVLVVLGWRFSAKPELPPAIAADRGLEAELAAWRSER